MAPKRPVHPGEILESEFLKRLGITQYRLAKDIGVPARRINEIVLGKRSISPDTALRFALFFQNNEDYWMGLQADYELECVKQASAKEIEGEVKPYQYKKSE